MPRDGQDYFNAVNMNRTLVPLPWLRVPPDRGFWGTGPWGNFPWGGARVSATTGAGPDQLLFNFFTAGSNVLIELYWALPPYPLTQVNLYFKPLNTLTKPALWNTGYKYGGSLGQGDPLTWIVNQQIKDAGAWRSGAAVGLIAEFGLLGDAPMIRVSASTLCP